jgi:hypothetical protein
MGIEDDKQRAGHQQSQFPAFEHCHSVPRSGASDGSRARSGAGQNWQALARCAREPTAGAQRHFISAGRNSEICGNAISVASSVPAALSQQAKAVPALLRLL